MGVCARALIVHTDRQGFDLQHDCSKHMVMAEDNMTETEGITIVTRQSADKKRWKRNNHHRFVFIVFH